MPRDYIEIRSLTSQTDLMSLISAIILAGLAARRPLDESDPAKAVYMAKAVVGEVENGKAP